MTDERFNIEGGCYQGKTRPIIYDNESSNEDYYFCGDYEDFKKICEQFNDFDIENKNLKRENKQLKRELERMAKKNKQLCLAQKKQKKKSKKNKEKCSCGFRTNGQLHLGPMNLCE